MHPAEDPDTDQPLNSHDITAFHKPRRPLEIFKKVGIPIIAVLLSLAAIATVAIIIKVVLVRYYFICESPLAFIPREQVCDGHLDCALGEDEEHCVKNFPEKPGVTDTVRPICLPFSDEELIPGTPLWVIGWGFTEQNGGSMSDVLLQASIQLIDSTRCNAEDAYQGEVTSEMVCAGTPQGGVDACQGDSGGPLMYHSGHWQIVGIVSWGYGCGSPSTPGVYTKVSAFLNWIYNVRKVSV
ncbi:transmembrane protease serine 4 [Cricetulus griseus]